MFSVSNYVTSVIRTLVPLLVGWLLGLPVTPSIIHALGVTTPAADQSLTALFSMALAFAYYLLVRGLEERFPALGALLGVPAKPTYDNGRVIDLQPVSAKLQSAAAAPSTVIHVHASGPADTTFSAPVVTTSPPVVVPASTSSTTASVASGDQLGTPVFAPEPSLTPIGDDAQHAAAAASAAG